MEIGIKMYFSVSTAFERKRMDLNRIARLHTSLTSQETLYHSEQLDHFVNLYQKQNSSELEICENLEGATLTIEFNGQLDIVTSDVLTTYIETNRDRWIRIEELNIDLIELSFFDTSGIHSLVLLILEARENSVSIKTINTSESTFQILNVMGIADALEENNSGIFKVI